MVREIAGGFLLVTERTFKRFSPDQLRKLSFELDRFVIQARSEQPPQEDLQAIQKRHRTLQRLTTSRMMLRGYLTRLRG
ncbi:MAG: hypothetical protein K0U98_26770 [Deltaproteobacteria bacterium]|nr:hypothetical protein [Deltaproteobacteria bacterium]